MERWDLVQSTSDREDSSWIEDFADETLGDNEAGERFLDQVLSPSTKARRDFRGSLRKLRPWHETAITEISRTLRYLVSWPLGSAVHVGDVGFFDSGISFVRLTQMSALGTDMPPAEVVTEALPTDLNYTRGDVSVVVTDPGVRIEFAAAGAAFFLATGLSSHRISSLPQFDQEIQALVRAGKWQEEWNAVTETVEARQVLFFVANEDGASVELLGDPRSLGVVSADEMPQVVGHNGMQLNCVASQGAVPLFRTVKVSKNRRLSLVRTFN
jgi:hypothetical protein